MDVQFNGTTIRVPDGATDAQISAILAEVMKQPDMHATFSGVGVGLAPGSATAIRPVEAPAFDATPTGPAYTPLKAGMSDPDPSLARPTEAEQAEAAAELDDIFTQAWRAPAHWLSDLAGTPIDLFNLGARGKRWLEDKIGFPIPSDGFSQHFAETGDVMPGGSADMGRWTVESGFGGLIPGIGPTPEPTTDAGRYTAAILRGANPIAFAAAPGRIPLGMAAGGAGGAAFEVGRDVGLPDPVNLFLAVLAAGGVDAAGGLLAPRGSNIFTPNAGKMIRDQLNDVPPATLAEAQRVQDAGGLLGIPLTFAESIGEGGLLGIAGDVGTSRQGAGLLDTYYRERIPAMRDAYNASVDQFGPRPATPGAAAEAAQGAAETAVGAVRGARSAAADPYYAAADPQRVAGADIQALIDELGQMNPGRGTALEREIDALRRSLLTGRTIDPNTLAPPIPDPITGITPPGVPEVQTLIEPLSDVYKTFRGRMDLPMVAPDAIDNVIAGRLGPINRRLRDILMGNPDFAAGQQTYAAMSPPVTAVERSPVGTIATAERPVGMPPIEAMINAFTNPKSIRPQDISFTAQALGASNPAAFRGLVQVYLENVLDQQLGRGGLAAESNPRVGSMVQDALGKPATQTAANVEQMLREMAVPAGLNPDEVIAGWRDMMTVFDRTGRTPGMGSRTDIRAETRAAAGENPVSAVADLAGATPLRSFADWMKERTYRGAYRDIARALVAPDSLAAMAALGRTGTWSPKSMFWAQQAVGLNANAQN